MSRWPAVRRAREAGAAGRVGALLGAVVLASGLMGSGASAETSDEARLAAEQAAAQVQTLQRQVEQARADYLGALNGLAGAVNRSVSADQTAMSALAAATEAEDAQARTVRAIYVNGGQLGLLGDVLSSESPGDVATRWAVANRVMAVATEQVSTTGQAVSRASAEASVARKAAERRIGTVQDVEAAYARLETLLQQQQQILDRLDARAKELADAEALAQRIAAEQAAAASAASASASQVTAAGIPAAYERLYRAAATTCHGLSWTVLAAIGQVESGHGTNMGPSSAGAMGPMQFLPSTFAAYAVDGNGDGDTDIWEPADSVFTAAHYLCANGAGGGPQPLYNAIYRYNHADWYVQMVMHVAEQIAQRAGEAVPVATAP